MTHTEDHDALMRRAAELTEPSPEAVNRVRRRLAQSLAEGQVASPRLEELAGPRPGAIERVKRRLVGRSRADASQDLGWGGRFAVIGLATATAVLAFVAVRGDGVGLGSELPRTAQVTVPSDPDSEEGREAPAQEAPQIAQEGASSSGAPVEAAPRRRPRSPQLARETGSARVAKVSDVRGFGQVDAEVVKSMLSKAAPALSSCRQGGADARALEITVAVDEEGRPGGVRVAGVSPEERRCLETVLLALRFGTKGSLRAGLEEQVTGGAVRFTLGGDQ